MTTTLLMPDPEEPHKQGDAVRIAVVGHSSAGKSTTLGRLIAVQDTAELRERIGDEVAILYFAGHGIRHGDIHAGNVLVADGSGLTLLDVARTHAAFLNTGHAGGTLPPMGFAGPAYRAAMEALTGVLNRKTDALDDFIETWLNRKAANWRLAVTNALLEETWQNLDLADNEAVIKEIDGRAHSANRALKPLWERQIGGSRLEMLERPVTRNGESHGTLADLVNTSRSAESHVLEYIDHQFPKVGDPCIDTVVAKLTDEEARAVWAYAHERVPWHEAALRAGAQNPKTFGETLAQKLRRAGRRHLNAVKKARQAWEADGRREAHPPVCRHWHLFASVKDARRAGLPAAAEGGPL